MDEWWKNIADHMRDDKEIVNWQCFGCGKIFNGSEKELAIKHIQEKHEYGRLYPRLSEAAIGELNELFDKSGQSWPVPVGDILSKSGFNYIKVTGNKIEEITLDEKSLEDTEAVVGTFPIDPELLSTVIADHAERYKGYQFKTSTGYIKLTNLLENKIVFRRKMMRGLIKIDIRGTYWHRGDQALPNTLVSWKLLQLNTDQVELRAYVNCEEYFNLAKNYLLEKYKHSEENKNNREKLNLLIARNKKEAMEKVKDITWLAKAVEMLWDGYTDYEISKEVNYDEKTVRNQFSLLRKEFGTDLFPKRKMLRDMGIKLRF